MRSRISTFTSLTLAQHQAPDRQPARVSSLPRLFFALLWVLTLAIFPLERALANDHGGGEEHAAPAEHGEEKAEGGEHGGGHGEAADKPKGPTKCRWSEHQSRLTSYTAKIRSFEKEISDMIEVKHHTEKPEALKTLTQQIVFKHADLAKVVRDYETERLHVRFQHPDRDRERERQYPSQRLKSLDEIETAFGIDGRLDRIKKQVEIVLPSRDPVPAAERGVASEPGAPADDEDKPERIHLVK